jgi:predicted ATPase/class 3 adenylate cyclase
MPELPTGTVTFLFTDIQGSTRLLTEAGSQYAALLAEHRRLIGAAVAGSGGSIFGTEGDAVFAVFDRAGAALAAAAEMQRAIERHPWPDGRQIRVRAGIHSGEVALTDGGYVGLAIHEVARISAAGHGGQVLVSAATRELAADAQPLGVILRDLGEHRLKDFAHSVRLYQLAGDGLADGFPPLRTMGSRSDNLPPQLTSFVPRDEVEEAMRLLAGTRLLTLTGPGGTGKTRLALKVAADVIEDFADGVVFVPLDGISDPELVPSAIVTALGLASGSGGASEPMKRIVEYLRDRSALVVLDNFEQVVDAAPLLAELQREATGVKVLATSRVPLRVSGEQELPVPPLSVPGDGAISADEALRSEAVRLFVERATAARPDFRLSDDSAATVADIVRRLDGLPLAIELAAARLRALSVQSLGERLDRRLAVLTGGARDLPVRQQTLRDTIAWSYELLDPADRELFERFGVFAGAACLVEAEPVCGPAEELGEDVLDGLASLTEKSLLRPVLRPIEDPRFAMLATIREYATDRLEARAHAEDLRRRHAETYLALVESAAPGLQGPRGRFLLDRLDQDHDNLRLALDWAGERGEADFALRFLSGAWRFWQIRGHIHEGWERAQRVLALLSVANQPPALRARALGAAGGLAYWRGHVREAHELYRDALELARASGDASLEAEALTNMGFAPTPDATFGPLTAIEGRRYLTGAVDLFRTLDDREGLAAATWALGSSYLDSGDLEGGLPLIKESLALYRETQNQFGIGWGLFSLAYHAFLAGRLDEAVPHLVEAMQVFAASRDVSGIVSCILGVSLAARATGAMDHHWRLSGATAALSSKYGSALDSAVLEQFGIEPINRPTDADGQRAWDEGAAMNVDEALDYAFQVVGAVATPPAPAQGRS